MHRRKPRFVQGESPIILNRVMGLDLGTQKIGIARSDGTFTIRAPDLKGLDREQWLLPQIMAMIPHRCPLIVIEAPAIHGRNKKGRIRLLGFYRLVELELYTRRQRYGFIAATSAKKWATGDGHAGKRAMISAATADGGRIVASDDEADAYWLRSIGLELVGLGVDPKSKDWRQQTLLRLHQSIKQTQGLQ